MLAILKRPDLVVISQGGNWDGFGYTRLLKMHCKKYVVISQKATELYWPSDWMRPFCKKMYQEAIAAYFVSEHNLKLTEQQMGMALPNGAVVRNPFLTPWTGTLPWPKDDGVIRFACVGRYFPMEKGQDVLLRVLAQPKWQERNIQVNFFGEGDRVVGLTELAAFLGLKNVAFPGHTSDVAGIWETHHALILPTRAEGLPLVVVEVMLAGRVAIVTDIGGSAEVCTDGVTGFIAASPSEAAIDAAMERAWAERANWQAIGQVAATEIRKLVPENPGAELADRILAAGRESVITADDHALIK